MANRMRVDCDDKDHLYYQYQMQDSDAPTMKNRTVILNPSDVLHVPGLNFDGLVGYSPIAMAKNAIGLAIATEEYSAKFFANGATPGGIWEYPGTGTGRAGPQESSQNQCQWQETKLQLQSLFLPNRHLRRMR